MTHLLALTAESERLRLLLGVEDLLAGCGFERIAGVDEAGRGALAGPVVAAAVIPSRRRLVPGVDDSKALPPQRREVLAELIRDSALAWSVVAVEADVVDRINILEATKLAMRQALARLTPAPDCIVTDAVPLAATGWPCLAMVKGDALSYAVACASILAKVERDRRLAALGCDFPWYGFADHKGYAAPEHLSALGRFGPSPVHRLTFARVIPRQCEVAA